MSIQLWIVIPILILIQLFLFFIVFCLWEDGLRVASAIIFLCTLGVTAVTVSLPGAEDATNKAREACESKGNYWYDPPRAEGICLREEMVVND